MKIDQDKNRLVLEVRSKDELDVFYNLIHLNTFDDQQIHLPENFDWWVSLFGHYQQYLLLSSFEDQKNPGPSDFIIWDYENQQEVIRLANFQPELLHSGQLFGYYLEDLQKKTALSLDTLESFTIHQLPDTVPSLAGYPVFYQEGESSFETVRTFLELQGYQPILKIDYLEYRDWIVVACYEKADSTAASTYLTRKLLVVRGNETMLHEVLDQKMKGVADESFICLQNHLIFVQDRKTINIYDL
jgi:hypothetical protein